MNKNRSTYLVVIVLLSLLGCKIDNRLITSDVLPSVPASEAPKAEIQNFYSGFAEATSLGAPVFEFSAPPEITDLKLFTDAQCNNEIPSDASYNGSNFLIRDTATVNKYRSGEFSYYVEFKHESTTYCQFLTKFTHDPVYIVSVLADESRRGVYLGVDNKGGVKVYNTNPNAVGITDKMISEIEKTVKNPKKFGYSINSLYILTQADELYIYSSALFPIVPDYTDVKDLYFTTPTANSVAFVKNDGTVASFGSIGSAPGGLSDVKELASTRHGFVALTNAGAVTAWGAASLTNGVNPSNITGAVSMQPANFGLYDLGVVTLKSNGNVQYFGHTLRPGSPSAPRLTAVNGKQNIKFYPGLNSLALTYTDAGVTKGYAWTGKGHGNSAAYDAQLIDIKKLVPNNDAYVAVLNNSNIIYWGFFGASNIMPTAPESTGVVDAVANDYTISETINDIQGHAFALMRQDGTMSAIGHSLYGGDMSAVATEVNQIGIGVKKVVSTGRGFAALRNDGKVFVWGDCGLQAKVALLSDIEDIVSSRSRSTTTCGFAALSSDGRVSVVSNTDVKSDINLMGVHVKKILFAENMGLTYINAQDDIVRVGSGYTHLLNQATKSFVEMGHEFYTNTAGEIYSVDTFSKDCITTTLSLNVSQLTHFSSYFCLLNFYKTNGVWSYANDAAMAAINADSAAFVAVLNSQNIQKVWITAAYFIALDVDGTIFYRQFDPGAPSMAALDLSAGVRDISYSASYVFVPGLVFHMKDNTIRYLGEAPAYQNFMGAIEDLTNINQIAVNVRVGTTATDVIVKNNSNALSIWSTEAAPTYAFLADYVDALATEEGHWVLKKNDGDYYFYDSVQDDLVQFGPGSIVTNAANNIKHKNKRVFIKLANFKLAMVSRDSAKQITYDANDDGFSTVYSSDGQTFFAHYPNGSVKKLRVLDSTSY